MNCGQEAHPHHPHYSANVINRAWATKGLDGNQWGELKIESKIYSDYSGRCIQEKFGESISRQDTSFLLHETKNFNTIFRLFVLLLLLLMFVVVVVVAVSL